MLTASSVWVEHLLHVQRRLLESERLGSSFNYVGDGISDMLPESTWGWRKEIWHQILALSSYIFKTTIALNVHQPQYQDLKSFADRLQISEPLAMVKNKLASHRTLYSFGFNVIDKGTSKLSCLYLQGTVGPTFIEFLKLCPDLDAKKPEHLPRWLEGWLSG